MCERDEDEGRCEGREREGVGSAKGSGETDDDERMVRGICWGNLPGDVDGRAGEGSERVLPSARLLGDEGEEEAGEGGLAVATPLGRLRSAFEADSIGIDGALTTLSAVARTSPVQVELDFAAGRTSSELDGAASSVVDPITGERSSSGGVAEAGWRDRRVER